MEAGGSVRSVLTQGRVGAGRVGAGRARRVTRHVIMCRGLVQTNFHFSNLIRGLGGREQA